MSLREGALKLSLARTGLCALVLLAGPGAAFGVEPPKGKVEALDVTDFGIYTADKTASMTNDQGLTHNTVNNIQYIVATNTIQAQLGLKFGFRYRIEGTPDAARVEIRQVTIYPSEGISSPKLGLLKTNSFTTTYRIGMPPIFAGYDITEPWEMVPGIWTIQLWIGDQKFAEQSFTVVLPQGDKPNPLQN